ncbi:prolyl 4-hydroxylase subunit alpha, putative [Plasmodium ovale wallikeri]|uniref:Prolyl 4-hydroxylase subunit alpha, putative n=2 Tax=Plasmodium ovale TaxID=36330 RepID=A0A1A8YMB0_PLAOA|nr:prolyl 4-hydroxylase subunit alpha, putative [Plasmodium ovale wallikeri]SBT32505.1 prolyl 4-hydroxylase subunit alpha, putative [Plasmodium ovale wallikeri]SBT75777.1 prolyl 4-hydroxylase subunit alpha, putative [Plasmodium ovale]
MEEKKNLESQKNVYDINDDDEKKPNMKKEEQNMQSPAKQGEEHAVEEASREKAVSEEAAKGEENEFGIRLYDNDIKYSDDVDTIIKKVINEKNMHFYKKHSSFLLYISNQVVYNEKEENRPINSKYANDNNTKVFFKIQLNPQNMSIIYNILDKNMIKKILSLCDNKYKKSKTSVGYSTDKQENYKITNSVNRTSSTVFIYTIRSRSVIEKKQVDEECSIVYTKDESIIELENNICNLVKIPVCYLEPLAVVKYEKNNYFNLHHDGAFRKATLLIYLNDVDKDGETIFPYHDLTIKPIQGSGIFWYNSIPVEEEYAITYCMRRITHYYEQENLKHNKNAEEDINTNNQNDSKNTFFISSSKSKNSSLTRYNTYTNEQSYENKSRINKTMDLIRFLSDKSNLQKYSIEVVNDELGNMYIADNTMVHKANKVTDECKYVINCFFNINIVRNV